MQLTDLYPAIRKIRSYSHIIRRVARPRPLELTHLAPANPGTETKHILLIHGWGSCSEDMLFWAHALRETDVGGGFHFWLPTYDTAWRAFPQSARTLKVLLERNTLDFTRTLILGYSQGGLVARALAREGFPFSHLVALCSPHQGAAPWIPLSWRRTRSLSSDSSLLRNLNGNSGDWAFRARYHFWGLTYSDPAGIHQHDGLVELSSALGNDISGNIDRRAFSMHFHHHLRGLNLSSPHINALSPQHMPAALAALQELMQKM